MPNAKVLESKKAIVDALADKLQNAATGAGAELKDVATAGFKSLLAGWEEFKKTYGEQRKSDK